MSKVKSEIAENATREIVKQIQLWFAGKRGFDELEIKAIVERAIAESQAPCQHLNRISSIEPDSPILCTDCDTYLPKTKLGDGEPSPPLARIREALRQHWPHQVICDHEAKKDAVACSCALWIGTPQPSVGQAIEKWIAHVFAESGATQEVSPPSPEPTLAIAGQIVDKLVLALCDEHISEQRRAGLVSETAGLISQAEGDTRELKAALALGLKLIKSANRKRDQPWWDDALAFTVEAERLLG